MSERLQTQPPGWLASVRMPSGYYRGVPVALLPDSHLGTYLRRPRSEWSAGLRLALYLVGLERGLDVEQERKP